MHFKERPKIGLGLRAAPCALLQSMHAQMRADHERA